jgi:hypothetical protein
MTSAASLKPSPKAGASVPAENLSFDMSTTNYSRKKRQYGRQDIEVPGEPEEEDLV